MTPEATAFGPGMAEVVGDVRRHSREVVRELGFMNRTIAGTDLPASAVHAIVEVGAAEGITSKQLAALLLLEKSTVSRLVSALIDKGVLQEARSAEDGRVKNLRLTRQGRATLRQIDRHAAMRVVGAIGALDDAGRWAVVRGLGTYAAALRRTRSDDGVGEAGMRHGAVNVDFGAGYRPGLVGDVVAMHAAFYSQTVGFGAAFEAKVAGGMAEFVGRLSRPGNGIWHARLDSRIVGSVAIDGEGLADGAAHLRWFIVDKDVRGGGIGRRLLTDATTFCDDQGFAETRLWTFDGLNAARRLYEQHGFVLADERPGQTWGKEVLEQQFVRRR